MSLFITVVNVEGWVHFILSSVQSSLDYKHKFTNTDHAQKGSSSPIHCRDVSCYSLYSDDALCNFIAAAFMELHDYHRPQWLSIFCKYTWVYVLFIIANCTIYWIHCNTSSLFICFGHSVRVKGCISVGTPEIGFHFFLCQEACVPPFLSSLSLIRL